MIVMVTGGRDFSDEAFAHRILNELYVERPVEALAHGDVWGLDRIAGAWARERGICEIKVPGPWDRYGSFAGPLRNAWLLKFVPFDMLLAFPGNTGTRNMIQQAMEAGHAEKIRYPKP